MNKNKKPLLLLVLPQVQEGLFCCIHFLFCLFFIIRQTANRKIPLSPYISKIVNRLLLHKQKDLQQRCFWL